VNVQTTNSAETPETPETPPAVPKRKRRIWILLLSLLIVITWFVWQRNDAPRPSTTSSDTAELEKNLERAAGDQGTVTLADRTYRVDRALVVPAGVTVRGNGATLHLSKTVDKFITLKSGSNLSDLTVEGGGQARILVAFAKGASDVEILDCTVEGRGTERIGIGTISGGSGLAVRDTTVRNVRSAIEITDDTSAVVVERVRIQRWSTRGIRIQGGPKGSSHRLRITGVQIGPNSGKSRSRYPIAALSTGARHQDISVEGSTVIGRDTAFDDRSTPGTADQISITKTDGVVIRNNRSIDAGERGINVSAAREVVVAGNFVVGADTVGIGIGSNGPGKEVTDVELTGNTVIDSGMSRRGTTVDASLAAVRLTRVADGVVANNQLVATPGVGNQKYAIALDGVTRVVVRDNSIEGDLQRLFRVRDGDSAEGRE